VLVDVSVMRKLLSNIGTQRPVVENDRGKKFDSPSVDMEDGHLKQRRHVLDDVLVEWKRLSKPFKPIGHSAVVRVSIGKKYECDWTPLSDISSNGTMC
jgi:hypothetical protein